jgi:hypothetical protein
MARQIIMDPSGHSTFEFDTNSKLERADAERRFNKLVGRGYTPAEKRGEGTHHVPDKATRVFNPEVEETIFIPALRGG